MTDQPQDPMLTDQPQDPMLTGPNGEQLSEEQLREAYEAEL